MVYLIWGIFNCLFFITWAYLSFKFFRGKPKFISNHPYIYSAIIIFGFLCFFSGISSKAESKHSYYQKSSKMYQTKANQSISFDTKFTILKDDESGLFIYDQSQSILQGFVFGFDWEQSLVKEKENDLELAGILRWKILGMTLYRDQKTYIIPKESLQSVL